MLRRFLIKSANKKLKLQGTHLVDGETRISWDVSSGFGVSSGEQFDSVLLRYGLTRQSFEVFASSQNTIKERREGSRKNFVGESSTSQL